MYLLIKPLLLSNTLVSILDDNFLFYGSLDLYGHMDQWSAPIQISLVCDSVKHSK